jgi:hypothetical protein
MEELSDGKILIGCYDGDALVGKAHFEIRPKQGWLESANTEVNKKYQKKGIASTMYAYAKMLGNDITPSPHQSNMGKKMWAAWDKSGDAQYLMREDPEEFNHWYDAGVKDAQRDAKLYPDRVVKKLNPRTRLKTMQDKRARHPDEVEQYSLGYRSVRQGVAEASGYIPSEKQKNDPRFKTALTVDVHPDSIKKNAKAFYWNTSRAGIPPTAKANGKIY